MDFRDLFKDKKFNIIFSIILGLFLAVLFKPVCRGNKCLNYKTPPIHEITEGAYKIGDKCYKFTAVDATCPANGVIEPYINLSA